ncbi:MAG TPA: P63C domain-containing protein, partial [Bacteroidia bacterium]|nr:P63C domain-containing protein [Bacteroidia bacterium]
VINLKGLRHYIDNKINAYAKKFGQDFYMQIFRLNGWAIPANGKISRKPGVVGKFTIDIIYGRFPKEVLPQLEGNNRFNEIGMRLYKHFQFLTPEGVQKLEQFIKDSVKIMERCHNWSEFVSEHAKAFGHPFQTSLLFES